MSNGFRYCLNIVDRFSRWAEAIPLVDITAETVVREFVENWVSRFGVPEKLITDRGRQFDCALFRDLMKQRGIHRCLTTAYHPQGNAMVERFNRTLKAALMAKEQQWHDALPLVLLGL